MIKWFISLFKRQEPRQAVMNDIGLLMLPSWQYEMMRNHALSPAELAAQAAWPQARSAGSVPLPRGWSVAPSVASSRSIFGTAAFALPLLLRPCASTVDAAVVLPAWSSAVVSGRSL